MQAFIHRYHEVRDDLGKAVPQLQELLEIILKDQRILFLAVSVRVKTLESAIRKINKKKYTSPWAQTMDLLGGRIFTYFRPDAIQVEEVIRANFVVHEEHSKNKSDDLEFNKFGYTSRHLICSLPERFPDLRLKTLIPEGMKFEFQIRSVLEHGWAEIEHEIVYKSETEPPDAIRRRFAASAAALEIVEREFENLRGFEIQLAKERSATISRNLGVALDRAWFIAVLMREYPDRATWDPDPQKNVFFRGYELMLIESLRAIGVSTVRDFRSRLRRARTKRLVREYADKRALAESQVSHLPIAIFATYFDRQTPVHRELQQVADATMREMLGI